MRLNPRFFFYACCLSLGIALFSCTVQKRTYFSGYTFTWKGLRHTSPAKDPAPEMITSRSSMAAQNPVMNEPLLHKAIHPVSSFNKPSLSAPDTIHGCDSIFFKHKAAISAKILQISPTEVRYRWCDNPDGPIYVCHRENIRSIKYANGLEELIDNSENHPKDRTGETKSNARTSREDPSAPKRLNLFALFGLLLSITLFLLPLGTILCIIALIQISRHPGKYKGEALAWIGLAILALAVLFGVLGILILLLTAL
jgi:hypothetical protein